MKYALILSGNLRNFSSPHILNYYKDIANKYDLDVFCFTDDHNFLYNNIQYLKKTVDNNFDLSKYPLHNNHKFVENEEACNLIYEILSNCFGNHLKKYKIIPYFNFFVPFDIDNKYHINYYNIKSRPVNEKINLMHQSYKVYKSFKLLEEYEIENNFKYDVIIKSRFDCMPYDILNNVDINNIDYNDDTLICGHWSGFLFDHGAMGTRKVMEDFCNYYNYMSPNLMENKMLYWYSRSEPWIYSETKLPNFEDASDSLEYGLTYWMRDLKKYKLKHYNINFRHLIAGPSPNF